MFFRDFCFWNNSHWYGCKLDVLLYMFLKSKEVWFILRPSGLSINGKGAKNSYIQITYIIILNKFQKAHVFIYLSRDILILLKKKFIQTEIYLDCLEHV